jgi:23S rRNA pseudouridine1911/1915/1917 synthase
MISKLSYRVRSDEAGTRLDKFLAARSGLPRLLCRRAIEEGAVWASANKGRRRLRRLSFPVAAGQVIEMHHGPAAGEPPPEPLRILHEDSALVAIDKPAGLPSQGTLQSDRRDALALASQQTNQRLRTVHRLDAGTSGVLLFAKNHDIASALAQQFRDGTARKVYRAIAVGRLPQTTGLIDLPLGADRRPGSRRVTADGAPAQTNYHVLAAREPLLLLELRPHTGRTHQLRVHLAHLGAPILGDGRYRGPRALTLPDGTFVGADRPLLHAAELSVVHPVTGKPLVLRAEVPADFSSVEEAIRKKE